MGDDLDPAAAWAALVDDLRTAGERMADVADHDPLERADAYRALLRALNNQLGRFEVDRRRPELVPFNGWREKFLMDNPDFRYWVADIVDTGTYRIVGNIGAAVYLSITAYAAAGVAEAAATSRIDSDALAIADDGSYELIVSRDDPGDHGSSGTGAKGSGLGVSPWLELPDGATALWVRGFHDDPDADPDDEPGDDRGADRGDGRGAEPGDGRGDADRGGWCRIEPLDDPPPAPLIDAARFEHHLQRLGATMARFPRIVAAATAPDRAAPNSVRHWSEMTGGAAFTEPAIHYLRGAWELGADEALVIEGPLVDCRYWNVLLYSRYLNSLDARHRRVSRTAATSTLHDGRYRFVIAARDPGAGGGPGVGDWLDTEGRSFGIFVMRFLQPATTPELPTIERVHLDEGHDLDDLDDLHDLHELDELHELGGRS